MQLEERGLLNVRRALVDLPVAGQIISLDEAWRLDDVPSSLLGLDGEFDLGALGL